MGKQTRIISIGTVKIGGGLPVVLQSMAAVKTVNVEAVAETCRMLTDAGAGLVRIAVDTAADAEALKQIRQRTNANLSVDLQENYRLAEAVAPFVDKIRYNPGHLHHAEPDVPWQTKVERIVNIARQHGCALRIGVNCGSLGGSGQWSVDSGQLGNEKLTTDHRPLTTALQHAAFLDSLGFDRYCVSIKSSDPAAVLAANRQFAAQRPDVPLHLGLTEAGLPPMGIDKSRLALEPLLAEDIGDTLRVSLTVPNDRKYEEIDAGRLILHNAALRAAGLRAADFSPPNKLNLISCPSCSRVENDRFVDLAERVRAAVQPWNEVPLTIAVMGCRVNGPGETDHADIGLWCGANAVNLKRGSTLLGTFGYDEVIGNMLDVLREVVANRI